MKRILLVAAFLFTATALWAQTVTVTANNIVGIDGAPLAAGYFCLTPVNAQGQPQFFVSNSKQFLASQRCWSVTAGIATGVVVPDTSTTSPAIGYLPVILNTAKQPIQLYGAVFYPTASSYSFDTWVPSSPVFTLGAGLVAFGSTASTSPCTKPSFGYVDSGTLYYCPSNGSQFTAIAGGGGPAVAIETNGGNNGSQSALNFATSSANTDNLTVTPSNSGATEKFEVSGNPKFADIITGGGSVIDARYYGVVGDGSTDNGTLLANLYSTVCGNPVMPRNIQLPPGTIVTSTPIAPPATCYKLKTFGAGSGGRTGSPTQSLGSTRISYTGSSGAALTLGTEATPVKTTIASASRTSNVITVVTGYNAALAALTNTDQIMVRGLVPSDLNTEDVYLASVATDGSSEVTLTFNSTGSNETASSVSGAYADYAHNDNAYYPSSDSGFGLENLSISCDSGTRTNLLNYQSYTGQQSYATTADGIEAWRAPNLVLNHVNVQGCRYGFYGTNSDEDKFNDVRFTNNHIAKYLDTQSSQFEDRFPYTSGNDESYLIDGAWGTVVYNWTSDTDGSATTSPVTLQATQQARNTVGFKCVNCWFENNHGSTTTAYKSYMSIGETGSGNVLAVDIETPMFSTPVVPSASAPQTTSFATIGNGDQIHVLNPININHTGSNIQPNPFFNFTGSYSPQDILVETGLQPLTTLSVNTGSGSPQVIWNQHNAGILSLGSKHTQVAPLGTASSGTTGYNSDFFDICGSFYVPSTTYTPCWEMQVASGPSFANMTVQPTTAGSPTTQWAWGEPLASTSGTNYGGIPMLWQAHVQHAGADTTSSMKFQVVPLANGNDPAIEWRFNHSGSDTGAIDVAFPSVKSTLQGSETVAFSATPTFSTSTRASVMTLTANVTSFTLTAGADGQEKTLIFCENGTGGFTVTPPSNVVNFSALNTAASTCSSQHFTYSVAQTVWVADGLGTGASVSSGSVALQTNGATNGSQTTLNFITSTTNNVGLTANALNSGSTEKIEITGSPNSLNGAAPPVSANVTGTNSSGQLTTATSAQIVAALNTTPTTTLATALIPSAINITGTAVNLSGTPALPNGTTATTQSTSDSSTDIATDHFVQLVLAGAGSLPTLPTAGSVAYNLCSTPSGGIGGAAAWCLAGVGGRTVTTTTDTIAATDRGASVTYNSASAVAVTLTSAATLGNNFDFVVGNLGAGTVTFTPSAGTINGGSTLAVAQNENCAINSQDNTNYVARCGFSTTGGGSGTPGGSSGQIEYNNSGAFGGYTQSGDCTTNTSTGVITCTKTGGTAFGGYATATYIANTTFTNATTAIAANSCSASAITVTMTGLTTTSVPVISPSTDVSGSTGWGSSGGLVIDAWPSAANTMSYKICNQTASSITPAAVTWNVGAR